MLRTIFFIFAIYFAYKFVFEFLIPLFTATKQMQQNIRSMQEDRIQQQGPSAAQPTQTPAKEKPVKHEYIDFEEVK